MCACSNKHRACQTKSAAHGQICFLLLPLLSPAASPPWLRSSFIFGLKFSSLFENTRCYIWHANYVKARRKHAGVAPPMRSCHERSGRYRRVSITPTPRVAAIHDRYDLISRSDRNHASGTPDFGRLHMPFGVHALQPAGSLSGRRSDPIRPAASQQYAPFCIICGREVKPGSRQAYGQHRLKSWCSAPCS